MGWVKGLEEGTSVDVNGTLWVHKDVGGSGVAEGTENRGGWHGDEEGGSDRVKAEMEQHRMGQDGHRRHKSPKQ